MASKRQLKDKVQATRSIRQITRAMEMVAAAKMRRAQERALLARPYALVALSVLGRLLETSRSRELTHPLFESREKGRTCLVVLTSDRGLAGSFNSAVIREAGKQVTSQTDVIAVGKKAAAAFGESVVASFPNFSDVVTVQDAEPLAAEVLRGYEEGRWSEVRLAGTAFLSALSQQVKTRSVLPLTAEGLEGIVDGILPRTGRYAEAAQEQLPATPATLLLEPSPQTLLDELVPELLRFTILHLLYESNASEHSARMVAMKNATENADSVLERLNLGLNKARQAAITQELAEISTAKEALSQEER